MRWTFRLLTILIFLGINTSLGFAGDFKIRAREHFDQVKLTYNEANQATQSVSGVGPTLNFWFEDPYVSSFGLAWGMTYLNTNGITPYGTGTKDTELWSLGIEGKQYFFPKAGGLFFRWGLSSEQLKTYDAFEQVKGTGKYLGLGYEIQFSRIGLAFEAAKRQINLSRGVLIEAQSPSIGVHFYGYI